MEKWPITEWLSDSARIVAHRGYLVISSPYQYKAGDVIPRGSATETGVLPQPLRIVREATAHDFLEQTALFELPDTVSADWFYVVESD